VEVTAAGAKQQHLLLLLRRLLQKWRLWPRRQYWSPDPSCPR
jgi:hypothetical protein